MTTIQNVASLELRESRWDLTIRVTTADGAVEEYVASADGFFTEGSGIWFGTRAEHTAALDSARSR